MLMILLQFKKPMNLKSPDFISHPEPGDEVHCVAVVVDASRARDDEEEDNNTRRQLIAFMDILHENGKWTISYRTK